MKGTALVTGATSGTGYEFSDILAADGYDLVLVGRGIDRMNSMKTELEGKYGIKVTPVQADLSVDDGARQVYDTVKGMGIRIDILVNNAGVGDWGRFVDISWEEERRLVGLNVISVIHLMHLYAADMEKQGGGKILNMCSIAAFTPGPYMPSYFASKGYVYSISQAVNTEMKGTGVTVTCVCPGPFDSNFKDAAKLGKESKLFSYFRPMTSRFVAEKAVKAMNKGKAVVTIKGLYRLLKLASRLSTDGMQCRSAKKINTGKF